MYKQACHENLYDLAIVGAGAAGSALLIQLMNLRIQTTKAIRVIVFDPCKMGEGIAFNQQEKFILCNTSIDVNSLYPDDSQHFLNWLKKHPYLCSIWGVKIDNLKPSNFVPRGLLKRYIVEHVREALALSRQYGFDIFHKREMVSSIEKTASGFLIVTENTCPIFAQNLVIGTGLSIPNVPFKNISDFGDAYVASPYDISSQPERFQDCSSVVILGTRQSAVDAALLVNHIAPSCNITMMSRSAQFPNVRTYMVEDKMYFFTYENLLKNLLLAPEKFAEYWYELITKELCAAASLKTQESHFACKMMPKDDFSSSPAIQNLYQNLLIAQSYSPFGAPWERIDRGIITVTNNIWPILSSAQRKSVTEIMKPFIRNMVSAIPITNAQKLINLAKAGKLNVTKGPKKIKVNRSGVLIIQDYSNCKYYAQKIINATGFTVSSKWDHLRAPPFIINNTNKTGPRGLFFLGPTSGDLQSISNYMNATVRQASSIAKVLQARLTNLLDNK